MATPGLPGAPLTKANWTWSATNIVVWNTIITVGLAIPVAAFAESFRHEPVEHPNGSWWWSYNVHVGDVLYLAQLEALVLDQQVEWNRTDEHGRVKDASHFGDGAWHCWDQNLDDIVCP